MLASRCWWLLHNDIPRYPQMLDQAGSRDPDHHRGSGRLTGCGVHGIVGALGAAVGAQVRLQGLRHLVITTVLDRSNGNMRAAQCFSRHQDIRILGIYDDNLSDTGGQMEALIAD